MPLFPGLPPPPPPLNFICPRHNFMLIRRCSPFFHPFEIGAVKNPFGTIFQILLHVRSQNHVVSHKKPTRTEEEEDEKRANVHVSIVCVCVCVWRETSNQGPSSWWWRWYRPPLSSFFLYRFSPPAQTWRLPLPPLLPCQRLHLQRVATTPRRTTTAHSSSFPPPYTYTCSMFTR